VLLGHEAGTYSAVFSPKGELIASGSRDKTVRLWQSARDGQSAVLAGHEAGVYRVAFSPDGARVASTSVDATIRIWDSKSGKSERILRGHADRVYGVAFAPDGATLASGGFDGTVRLWDTKSGEGRVLGKHPGRVYDVAFSSDGKRVATSCADGVGRLWDIGTRQSIELLGHGGELNAIAFRGDARTVVTGGDDGTVRLWDAATGRSVWRAPALLAAPARLFSHRGWRTLAPSGRLPPSPPQPPRETSFMTAIAERALFVSEAAPLACLRTHDERVEVWETAADRRLAEKAMPGIDEVVATGTGCAVRIGRAVRQLDRQGNTVDLSLAAVPRSLAWIGDALLVVAGDEVIRFDAAGRAQGRYKSGVGASAVGRTTLARDGASREMLVVGYHDGNVELIAKDVERPNPRFQQLPSSPVTRIIAGPRETAVVGHADGSLEILDLANGGVLRHARLHGPIVHVLVEGNALYAATSLGASLTWELGAFGMSRCDLLEKVWQEIPVVWQDGGIVEAGRPSAHACGRQN
jgi:WD40 repeat protein